jgi:hypothetical protein
MLKSLERAVDSADRRLVLLAPDLTVPESLHRVEVDALQHQKLVWEMQRLRGSVYLHDGAVNRSQLTPEGLHRTIEDDKSWHLLMLNQRGDVTGCAWYLEHPNTVQARQLRLRHCPLATAGKWRRKLWKAVESELAIARRERLVYAEVGGWAVAEESRATCEGLVLALAGYSLGRLCGGALGITTATVRHCSSSILRKIGGALLEVDGTIVPPYYDPRYNCEMEILRFDSRKPNAKFAGLIELLCHKLQNVLVITRPRSIPAVEVGKADLWNRTIVERWLAAIAS